MTASPTRPTAGTVVGAGCWILTVAYLLVQPVVAAAWQPSYDLATNTISDLGVTGCGDFRQFDDRVVYACSPRHALMNTVFVVVGVLTAAGAVLTRAIWPRRRLTSVGVAFVVLAGVGGILLGLAPTNVNPAAHGAGALLQVPGAVGPLLLGVAAWSHSGRSRRSPCCAVSSGQLPACCTSARSTLGWASATWSIWHSIR
jgi:hypothetical membrane protein